MEHRISKNILKNGKSYTAEIIVYDINNVPSETSDKIHFKTFTTPVFNISNLTDHQIVRTSGYELKIVYEQPESELLNEYQITLYDLSHNIVSQSGYLYPHNGMTYSLNSLLDNQGYYLKLTGITVNKMILDIPEMEFSVEYVQAAIYSKLILENLPVQGSVKIQSNLILIEGQANHEPVIYIDNEKVDLTENGKWIVYDEGFNIDNDFAVQIVVENIARNKTFFEFTDQSGTNRITIQKWFGHFYGYNEVKEYFVLHATNGTLTYRITSNFLDALTPDEQIELIVRRKNNLYSIIAKLAGAYKLDAGNAFAEFYHGLDRMVDGKNPNSIYVEDRDMYINGGEA